MSLIKCPECGKEISDMAKKCPNCGRPLVPKLPSMQNGNRNITHQKKNIRLILNVIAISISIIVVLAVVSSEGGPEGNYEIFNATLLLFIAAVIGICGRKNNSITVISSILYFFGALANLRYVTTHIQNVLFLGISLCFGTALLYDALNKKIST